MDKEELIKSQFPNDEFLQSAVLQIVNKCVSDLEKENKELNDKLDRIARNCRFNFVDLLHDVENEIKQEKENTQDKEIIKKLLQTLKNEGSDYTFALKNTHPVIVEAEQFLNSEVE